MLAHRARLCFNVSLFLYFINFLYFLYFIYFFGRDSGGTNPDTR
jgi:hypothetical protein